LLSVLSNQSLSSVSSTLSSHTMTSLYPSKALLMQHFFCPTPQHQLNSAHKPYGPTFTGFKTTLRYVQRPDILYHLLVK
jgi:hypothetical protein